MRMLNKEHKILSASHEELPERFQGVRQQICYFPKTDVVALIGWGENAALLEEMIADYLELAPGGHDEVLDRLSHTRMPGVCSELLQAFEEIYQIRKKKEGHRYEPIR